MALPQSDLSGLLAALKAGEMTDTIRRSLEWILQELIEAEATTVVGARLHERSDTRTTQRNGHRPRLAVVMEAYVHGVSIRKVDDLVGALGVASGISKPDLCRARHRPGGLSQPAARSRGVPLGLRRRHLHQGPGQGHSHARGSVPRRGHHARRCRRGPLAFATFPQAHWRKLWSTNPLERLNGEIKRRTNVVGIFPNDAAIARLVTAAVVEAHAEWTVAERRYLSEESMAKISTEPETKSRQRGAAPGRHQLSHNFDVERLSRRRATSPRGTRSFPAAVA